MFKIPWFRVILDEAAIIRNRVTKASRVVLELSAEIKWCLTVSYTRVGRWEAADKI